MIMVLCTLLFSSPPFPPLDSAWYPFIASGNAYYPFPVPDTSHTVFGHTGDYTLQGPITTSDTIYVCGIHLCRNGTPVRFYGGTVGGPNWLPQDSAQAETLAAMIAKLGFNMVRITNIEYVLQDDIHGDKLKPGQVRKIKWVFQALKRRGIYLMMDALQFMQFKPGDYRYIFNNVSSTDSTTLRLIWLHIIDTTNKIEWNGSDTTQKANFHVPSGRKKTSQTIPDQPPE